MLMMNQSLAVYLKKMKFSLAAVIPDSAGWQIFTSNQNVHLFSHSKCFFLGIFLSFVHHQTSKKENSIHKKILPCRSFSSIIDVFFHPDNYLLFKLDRFYFTFHLSQYHFQISLSDSIRICLFNNCWILFY